MEKKKKKKKKRERQQQQQRLHRMQRRHQQLLPFLLLLPSLPLEPSRSEGSEAGPLEESGARRRGPGVELIEREGGKRKKMDGELRSMGANGFSMLSFSSLSLPRPPFSEGGTGSRLRSTGCLEETRNSPRRGEKENGVAIFGARGTATISTTPSFLVREKRREKKRTRKNVFFVLTNSLSLSRLLSLFSLSPLSLSHQI